LIEPQPKGEGQWRLNGLDTILYDCSNAEFSNSEKYKVTVPASATSNLEEILGKEFSFEFSTPLINFKSCVPSSGITTLSPIMIAVFDQKIHPPDAVKSIRFDLSKKEVYTAVLLEEDITVYSHLSYYTQLMNVKLQNPDRHIIFKPSRAFPPGASVKCTCENVRE
jgi:hypothetical protein